MKNTNKLLVVFLALAIVLSSIAVTTLTTSAADYGVILEWDFNTDGQANDISGNGNNGTVDGATVANGVATFNGGETEYVHFPDNLFDGFSANDIVTIEVVMTPFETNNYTSWMHFGESNQNFVVLGIMGDGNLRYATNAAEKGNGEIWVNSDNGGDFGSFTKSKPLTLNEANTVKYVMAPNVTNVYVNGEHVMKLFTNENYFIGNVDSKGKLGGKAFWNDPCLKGSIDSVKISVEKGADPVTVDPSVMPTLEETENTVLGYFSADESSRVNVSQVADNVTIADGVASFSGAKSDNVEDVTNAIVFNSALLAGIEDELTFEMVVKPEVVSEHRILMSFGNEETFYMVMGMRNSEAVKFNEKRSVDHTLFPNEWVTLKYVVTNSASSVYINGVLYAEGAGVDLERVKASTERLKFGQRTIASWNDDSYQGLVSEIRISTKKAAGDVATINPYEPVKAGADATELSVGTTTPGNNAFGVEQNEGANKDGVGNSYNGAWMKYANVAFGETGAAKVTINYVSKATRMAEDAKAEIWVGGKSADENGTKIATVSLPVPEDREADYTPLTVTADLEAAVTGTQDVYVVLTGTTDGTTDNEYIANVTSFVFTKVESGEGEVVIVEGLNAKAWNFNADDYKTLFGEAPNGQNGDTIKAAIKAGTGLTARTDCQAIVPVDYVINADWYAIQYTGVMTVAETGWYQFATDKVDNGYVAYVGGVKVFDFAAHNAWADNDVESTFGETVYLEAGKKYSYEAYFVEQGGGQVASVQVVKADGKLYNCADAGIKFYANDTADKSAPVVWETIHQTITGSIGNIRGGDDAAFTGDNTLTVPAEDTGHVWNYSRGGYTKNSVVKVAFYVTVNSVADDVDPEAVNIIFDNNFGEVAEGVEVNGFLDIPNSVFTENVGKNIIVVGVFNHPSEWMEARWHINIAGISFTVNKVVVGDADTDFDCAAATMGGYKLAFEEANSEDIVYKTSASIKTDDTPTGSTKTGDVASVAAILLAGAAALGGLKLRKKSK